MKKLSDVVLTPLIELVLCFAMMADNNGGGEFTPMPISLAMIFAWPYAVIALVKRINVWKAEKKSGVADVTDRGAGLFEKASGCLLGVAFLSTLYSRGGSHNDAVTLVLMIVCGAGWGAAVFGPWAMLVFSPRYRKKK